MVFHIRKSHYRKFENYSLERKIYVKKLIIQCFIINTFLNTKCLIVFNIYAHTFIIFLLIYIVLKYFLNRAILIFIYDTKILHILLLVSKKNRVTCEFEMVTQYSQVSDGRWCGNNCSMCVCLFLLCDVLLMWIIKVGKE